MSEWERKLESVTLWKIFILALIARYAFAYLSGVDNFYNNDWSRYDGQSDAILSGNYNLEDTLFITAPLYSYLVALMKWWFGPGFVKTLEMLQIFLSAISVLYLTRMAQVIFDNKKISTLAGILYSLHPVTLFFTHILGQESLFQSLFIMSIYYLTAFMKQPRQKYLWLFALLFTLALLTKSHIILTLPFIVLSFLIRYGVNKKTLKYIVIFTGTVLVLTMPYGIYNKIENGVYIISSSGHGGHFLTGHNDDTYTFLVETPPRDSSEYKRIVNMDYHILRDLQPQAATLSHKEVQNLYFREGLRWSWENPKKFFLLGWDNLKAFITPGFSYDHYPFGKWLISLLLSLPVFLLAYGGLFLSLKQGFTSHLVMISVFLGTLALAIIFYNQNRFRVITLEPFYLLYASMMFWHLVDKLRQSR